MAKLICLSNFHCNDFEPKKKGDKPGAKPRHKHWIKGEEYTGEDDLDRLQDEGLIGPEEDEAPKAKPKKAPKKGGKKTADDLAEGQAMTLDGDEPTGTPADGGDGEEDAPEAPAKPAPRKGGKKKRS